MLTAVKKSSIECFHAHQDKFGAQERIILEYIRNNPGKTRREISKATDIETSSVAGRVNKLLTDKELHELPRRKCSISGVSSHTLMIKPTVPEQEKLFE
jgi:hypothetical protein